MKQIVCWAVLALWASCTIHCELEMFGSAKAVSCCKGCEGSGEGQPASPNPCVCSVIASGGYVVQKSAPLAALPPDALLVFNVAAESEDCLRVPVVEKLIFAPPELPRIWQFSLRTALPPRAPSVVS